MLAMLTSLGALLLDFATVSVSQYTAHVAEGLGHLLASREFSEISSHEDFHHASTAWFAFLFREW